MALKSHESDREEILMNRATIAPPKIRTIGDLLKRLGGISPDRIRFDPPPGTATVDDVVRIEVKENRACELVEGTLVEKAVGFEASRVAGWLLTLMNVFVDKKDLGICTGADGMMEIAPGLVRIPDVSFISWERIPGRESPKEPVPDLAPDLAVEVLSEGNTPAEMKRKVQEYFDAGARLVWLIDPKKRTARVYSSPARSVLVREHQSLDGGNVLPGFSIQLEALLDRGRRQRKT
jgi:Uma2 family endonuclease